MQKQKQRVKKPKQPKWQTDPYSDFVVEFCNQLCGSCDYLNKPTTLLPYQERLTRQLFGDRDEEGCRKIKRVFLGIPRKAGKTSLVGKWVLVLLVAEGTTGQFIVSVSGNEDQASQVFEYICDSIKASPFLSRRLKTNQNQKTIKDRVSGNTFRALSSEGDTKLGKNISTAIFDEGAFWENETLHRAITTATGARKQRLLIYLSTAGFNPYGWYKRLWDYALKVKNGEIDDPAFLVEIYAAEPNADIFDEKVWMETHPALGKFYELSQMREEAETAKYFPDQAAWFKTVYLNIWSNAGEKWLSTISWNACEEAYSWQDLEGQECYAGLDLAPVRDLSSLCLVFPQLDGTVKVLSRTWIPEEDIEARSKRDKVPYKQWAETGEIVVTKHKKTTDFNKIQSDIIELSKKYQIKNLQYDRAYAYQMAENLQEAGIDCTEFPQTIQAFSPACKYLERLILDKEIKHNGSKPLGWCLSNTVAYRDNNQNVRPDKKRSTERIDALVALIMALGGELASKSMPVKIFNPFSDAEATIDMWL